MKERLRALSRRSPVSTGFATFTLVTIGCVLVFQAMSWLMAPTVRTDLPPVDEAELARVRAIHDEIIDADAPLRIQVPMSDADYAAGTGAPWWPRSEAPLVAELRQELAAAPDAGLGDEQRRLRDLDVAERIGPEPCVVQGVDGVGEHGGTMVLAGDSPEVGHRFSGCTLLRWSPHGEPLVPHVAKSVEQSEDGTTITVTLRRGMRWSDGHPFTTADIAWWWEHEANGGTVTGAVEPSWLKLEGRMPTFEVLDEIRFRFTWHTANALFRAMCARAPGEELVNFPAHYLRPYHPVLGDQELIQREMAARGLAAPVALYRNIVKRSNPAIPRIWPWLIRRHQTTPPFTFVRNPYYWQVDTAGQQLPYIDRLFTEGFQKETLPNAVKTGNIQFSTFKVKDYSILMANRFDGEGPDRRQLYECYRWFRADRSDASVFINVNKAWRTFTWTQVPVQQAIGERLYAPVIEEQILLADREVEVDAALAERLLTAGVTTVQIITAEEVDEIARRKATLLKNVDFRRALSLAIDRESIITAVYHGETTPAQVSPGPESPWSHPRSFSAWVERDLDEANRLLDALGLERRGRWRCFPDGTRMNWILDYPNWFWDATAQYICDSWAEVGLYCTPRKRNTPLFYTSKANLEQDFTCFTGNNEFMPILDPRCYVPTGEEANWAIGYARWYVNGGLQGDPRARRPGCIEPRADDPTGPPARRSMELYNELKTTPSEQGQKALMAAILDIAADNVWTISVCTAPDYVVPVTTGLENVPRRALITFDFIAPANCGEETWYWSLAGRRNESERTRAEIKADIARVTEPPSSASTASVESPPDGTGGDLLGSIIVWLLLSAVLLALIALAVRHPFVGRRLLIMIPTMVAISIIAFTIIQLPPGDYLTTYIGQLQAEGQDIPAEQIENLREQYGLNLNPVHRYLRWSGMEWFVHFDSAHTGLLQGNLGRAMSQDNNRVNDIIGDRLLLTVLISIGTILFTWATAIPTGIYSAVRQYSVGDYTLTVLGFLGMCIPGFLLAIILMFLSELWFDLPIAGLFSAEYATQTGWSWGKFWDLCKHIWVPIVVLGVGGTGHMIRVMRANLLDELKKPYVTTARAKGVRPIKLLAKYPVRLALNPFISGIGGLFPALISGGTIVAVVLNLPTIGPLQLNAILNEDTYLAGSMLVILSLLAVIGTLVSDLLLLWLDPRIRLEGGAK